MRYIILTVCCLSFLAPVKAQQWFFNLQAGAANYDGELQTHKYTFQESHPGGGIGLGYEVNPHLTLSTDILLTQISGNDKYSNNFGSRERNANFTSNIFEWSVRAEYILFDLQDRSISPYIFAGLGIFHFNPYTNDSLGKKVFLQKIGTEGEGMPGYPAPYKLTQLAIPLGLGLRLALSDNVRVSLEAGLRKTTTGYLDDIHSTYVDYNTLVAGRGIEAAELAYRLGELKGVDHTSGAPNYPRGGTPRGDGHDDWYYFTAIRISFRINGGDYTTRQVRCPGSPM